MDWLEDKLTLVTRTAAILGVLFLLMVAGLSALDIIVREISGRPIRGAGDIAKLLTIIIIASSFPAGLLERKQVEVRLLGGLLGPKMNRAMDVLGTLLTGAMFLLIAYYVSIYAGKVSRSQEYSMVLNIPVGPWWWAASVCFWVCVPVQLFVILSELVGRKRTEPGS
tara:strand:- start:17665 stop:18165 length:501 start_codon:yes stop_codon:yes gene_type:complete